MIIIVSIDGFVIKSSIFNLSVVSGWIYTCEKTPYDPTHKKGPYI